MAKKYLTAGEQIKFSGLVARIGATQTVVDLAIDWSATADYCVNDSTRPGQGFEIGTTQNADSYTFDVFFETETGKLWYDDETGY